MFGVKDVPNGDSAVSDHRDGVYEDNIERFVRDDKQNMILCPRFKATRLGWVCITMSGSAKGHTHSNSNV